MIPTNAHQVMAHVEELTQAFEGVLSQVENSNTPATCFKIGFLLHQGPKDTSR